MAVAAAVFLGFPCFPCVPSMHAIVYTPVESSGARVASLPGPCCLPRLLGGSASTLSVSGPHRSFTCVMACIFAESPSDPFHRRLRRIRCLLRRFDCYWASDPSQAGLPPAETHKPSRRTNSFRFFHTNPLASSGSSLPALLRNASRVAHCRRKRATPKSFGDKRLRRSAGCGLNASCALCVARVRFAATRW